MRLHGAGQGGDPSQICGVQGKHLACYPITPVSRILAFKHRFADNGASSIMKMLMNQFLPIDDFKCSVLGTPQLF